MANVPDYIWEGVLQCVITLFSAGVMAWLTSLVFKRKDELTRVEGVLLEKKLDIYKNLYSKSMDMIDLRQFAEGEVSLILHEFDEVGLDRPQFLHVPTFMTDSERMHQTILDFDRLATENKMYYDDYSAVPVIVFQNYLAFLTRFHVMYVQALQDEGIKITDVVKQVENQMFLALGLLLCYEIGNQVEKLQNALQDSVNNLTLRHRKLPRYDAVMYLDPSGPIMKEMTSTILIQKQKEINQLVINFVALAIFGNSRARRGNLEGKGKN